MLSLRIGKEDVRTLSHKLSLFLLTYHSTPHATTGISPAELFLKWNIRIRLDLIRPSVRSYIQDKQATLKEQSEESAQVQNFSVGQTVLVRNMREEPRWCVGVVVQKLGPGINDQVWK